MADSTTTSTSESSDSDTDLDPDASETPSSDAEAHDIEWLEEDEGGEEWVSDEFFDDDDDDGDYVYVPEDRGIVRKIMVVGACMVLFVFLVIGLGGYWLYSQVNPGGDGTQVLLIIPKDAGLATISRLLEEKEIISNATIFRYYAKWKDIPTIKAGQYDKLYKHDSMDHVIERLKQGPLPPKTTKFGPVPEGLWLTDTVALMKKSFPDMTDDQAFLMAAKNIKSKYRQDGQPLDGFLFPAAYQVSDDNKDDPTVLLDQMVKQFDQVGNEIGLDDAANKLNGVAGKTEIGPYQAVIVAALVESEAKVPDDRARIARVIYNRLKNTPKEPIGIDSTVLFALGQHKTEITKSDLDIDSPYNLRKNPGLTPTPINSPGKDSLVAALNPSTEPGSDKWMYYVIADADGHHFFTGNYNEFLKAQQKARDAGLL